jgi:hypothetical protein
LFACAIIASILGTCPHMLGMEVRLMRRFMFGSRGSFAVLFVSCALVVTACGSVGPNTGVSCADVTSGKAATAAEVLDCAERATLTSADFDLTINIVSNDPPGASFRATGHGRVQTNPNSFVITYQTKTHDAATFTETTDANGIKMTLGDQTNNQTIKAAYNGEGLSSGVGVDVSSLSSMLDYTKFAPTAVEPGAVRGVQTIQLREAPLEKSLTFRNSGSGRATEIIDVDRQHFFPVQLQIKVVGGGGVGMVTLTFTNWSPGLASAPSFTSGNRATSAQSALAQDHGAAALSTGHHIAGRPDRRLAPALIGQEVSHALQPDHPTANIHWSAPSWYGAQGAVSTNTVSTGANSPQVFSFTSSSRTTSPLSVSRTLVAEAPLDGSNPELDNALQAYAKWLGENTRSCNGSELVANINIWAWYPDIRWVSAPVCS